MCLLCSHASVEGLTLRMIFEAGPLWEIEVHESEILVLSVPLFLQSYEEMSANHR